MQASDVMTIGAATIRPVAPIEEAARLMLLHRIRGLPGIDDTGKLVFRPAQQVTRRRAAAL